MDLLRTLGLLIFGASNMGDSLSQNLYKLQLDLQVDTEVLRLQHATRYSGKQSFRTISIRVRRLKECAIPLVGHVASMYSVESVLHSISMPTSRAEQVGGTGSAGTRMYSVPSHAICVYMFLYTSAPGLGVDVNPERDRLATLLW